jgi:hypothetical protein
MKSGFALFVSASILATGCLPAVSPATIASTSAPLAAPSTSAGSRLGDSTLKNATYHSPDWGNFQLDDGVYHRPPAAPGASASASATQLLEPVLYGDLNRDGIEDAALLLSTQNGGTGHFVELAAVLNQNGAARNVATVSLGDRVVMESGRVAAGTIILDMRVQGPNDGLCCPSQLVTWRYQLIGADLLKLP